MTDDDNHDANTEEGRQNLTQSISTITNESEEEELIRIYRHHLEEEEDAHKKEQVINIIKQRIWPTTKFSTSRIIEDTELMEEGNLLSEILHGMNLTNYSKTRRARFWNTYGKYILPELSKHRCNIQHRMKQYVVKGEMIIIG